MLQSKIYCNTRNKERERSSQMIRNKVDSTARKNY